jgi:hypothetical protein
MSMIACGFCTGACAGEALELGRLGRHAGKMMTGVPAGIEITTSRRAAPRRRSMAAAGRCW